MEFIRKSHGSRDARVAAHGLVIVPQIVGATSVTLTASVAVGVAVRAVEAHAHMRVPRAAGSAVRTIVKE